jgi:uncharacterized RDD family membrane protein YckC
METQTLISLAFVVIFWAVVIYVGVRLYRSTFRSIPAEEPTVGNVAGPWSRYFARLFDLLIESSIVAFFLGYFFDFAPDFDQATKNRLLANFVSNLLYTPPALIIDAALLAFVGSTLGKGMFGISLLAGDGSKLAFADALARNFKMWFFGWSLGFPIFAFFTCLINYQKVAAGKRVSWDKARHVNVTQSASTGRIAVGIVVTIGIAVVLNILPVLLELAR